MLPGFATPSVRRLKGLSEYGQPFVRLEFILCIYYMTTTVHQVFIMRNIIELPSAYIASSHYKLIFVLHIHGCSTGVS